MSCSRTFIPLLRPLVAPRAIVRPHRSCFSTAPRLCTAQPQPPIPKQPPQESALTKPDITSTTPVPTSSSSPPATTPPSSPTTTTTTTSTPSQQTASPPRPKPSTLNFDVSTLEPPRYHVGRTANNNLGVYTDYKRGGNLKQTSVRRITGDRKQLQDDLRRVLQKKDNEVWINTVTGAVYIKGHVKQPVFEFLEKRGF